MQTTKLFVDHFIADANEAYVDFDVLAELAYGRSWRDHMSRCTKRWLSTIRMAKEQ